VTRKPEKRGTGDDPQLVSLAKDDEDRFVPLGDPQLVSLAKDDEDRFTIDPRRGDNQTSDPSLLRVMPSSDETAAVEDKRTAGERERPERRGASIPLTTKADVERRDALAKRIAERLAKSR